MTDAGYWREAMSPRFWTEVLDQRYVLLADITARLTGKDFDGPSPLPSLATAKQRLDALEPADFASFTAAWLTSLAVWRDQRPAPARTVMADKARAVEKAIARLGLAHIVRSHEVSAYQAPAGGTGRISGFAGRWNRWTGPDTRLRFGARNEP